MAFAVAERSIGRDREFVADQAGVEVANSRVLATALLKTALRTDVEWHPSIKHAGSREGRGHFGPFGHFDGACSDLFDRLDWEASRERISQSAVPHPIDTHPPLAARLEKLGVSIAEIERGDLGTVAEPASALLQSVEAIGRELTVLEDRFLVENDFVRLPIAAVSSNKLGLRKGGDCYRCGTPTPDGASRCPACGASVSATASQE